ncbi:hypothetical protein AOZ06_07865 [Kibdelosporangium phytohabitans]|uniref:Lysozyme n=1 Tax=Kibdelosporangium phytohabitans TaxID=860235 RepID=A0A0N9HTU3_9PSEU|nr:hypothetical protein AOZ06_07865 [Kibdelosporangium phytohabitans]
MYGAGKRFAYIQLCRGVDSPDPLCVDNLKGAVAAGLAVGLYQRVFPQLGSPEQHALHYLACWNRVRAHVPDVTLPPAVDYEERIPGGGPWCMEYINIIRQATGRADHVIYSSGSWFEPNGFIGTTAWTDDPGIRIWPAHTDAWPYPGWAPGNPKFKHPRAFVHQYDQDGTCPGIEGKALLDISMKPLPLGRT